MDLNFGTKQGKRNYVILKKTLVGEAADEMEQGQRAICWVIYNRVVGHKTYWYDEKEGNTIAGVCLKRGQFECWNVGNAGLQMSKVFEDKTDFVRQERRGSNWKRH